MQTVPCALADITRSPAALQALRIIVDRVHVVKTAAHVLCRQWMAEKAKVPETEAELVQLFKNAFYVLSAPSKIHSEQQGELKNMCAVTMSTDGFSAKWVKHEAKLFVKSVAHMANRDCSTEFTKPPINAELTLSVENMVSLLPDRIFTDMTTSKQDIQNFLQRFKKPLPKQYNTKAQFKEAKLLSRQAHNWIWNLVFDCYMHPFNTGKFFQSIIIRTDRENCYLCFLE